MVKSNGADNIPSTPPTSTNQLRLWQLLVPQLALMLCFLSPWFVTQHTLGFTRLSKSKSERCDYCVESFLICDVQIWSHRLPLLNTPERQCVDAKQAVLFDLGILALLPLTTIPGFLCRWHTDFIGTGQRWRPKTVLWLSGLLAVIACAAVHLVCMLLHQWTSGLYEEVNLLLVAVRRQAYRNPAAVVLFLVAGPVLEELFFRAGVQRLLCRYTTHRLAISVSALIFAVHHSRSPFHIAFTFFAGLWLATVYERTGKLYVPVVSHVIGNVTAAIILLR